jgi:enoyl-CoA hydratase/carnithine racemase
MNFAHIGYEISGRVLTITLDNPARRNAYGPEMEQEMRTALEAGDRDPGVRAIIITGAGDSFCVGADMSTLASIGTEIPLPSPPSKEPEFEHDFEANYQRRFTYMLRIGTPVIAAINGPAAGVGVSICLFCDIRFMIEGAKLSTSFSRRGLIAEHGSSWMLSRLIGPMNALDLLMTGRKVTAAEAAQMGLVRCLPSLTFKQDIAHAPRPERDHHRHGDQRHPAVNQRELPRPAQRRAERGGQTAPIGQLAQQHRPGMTDQPIGIRGHGQVPVPARILRHEERSSFGRSQTVWLPRNLPERGALRYLPAPLRLLHSRGLPVIPGP